jgi:hypothetical protein
MAPFTKSLLVLLTEPAESFHMLYQRLRNKAVASHPHGWKTLQRQLGKRADESSTMELTRCLADWLGSAPPPTMDGLPRCCANLIALQSMHDGWCLSGGTLMMGVLDTVQHDLAPKGYWQPNKLIRPERLSQLLTCCCALEWSSRDCFVVMKKARALGLDQISTELQTALRDRFGWMDWLSVILMAQPVAPIEKLHVAREWFVKQGDGRMAIHVRHMIELAKRCGIRVYCTCLNTCCCWNIPSTQAAAAGGVGKTSSAHPTRSVPAIRAPASNPPGASRSVSGDKRKRPTSARPHESDTDSEEEEDEEDEDDEEDCEDTCSDPDAEDEEEAAIEDFTEALYEFEQQWIPPQRAQKEVEMEAISPSKRKSALVRLKQWTEEEKEKEDDSDWSEGASVADGSDAAESDDDDGDDDEEHSEDDDEGDSDEDVKERGSSSSKRINKGNAHKRPRLEENRTIPLMLPSDALVASSCVTANCQSDHVTARQLTAPLYSALVDKFVAEMCSVRPGLATSAADLYRRYHSWHRRSTPTDLRVPMGKKMFWRALAVRFCKSKTDGNVMYRGIAYD